MVGKGSCDSQTSKFAYINLDTLNSLRIEVHGFKNRGPPLPLSLYPPKQARSEHIWSGQARMWVWSVIVVVVSNITVGTRYAQTAC